MGGGGGGNMSMYLHAAAVELGFDDLFICSGNDMMAWIG